METTMDTLECLIRQAIRMKQGNKEFALWYYADDVDPHWCAGIGNPSRYVTLGESCPEVEAHAPSMRKAVTRLITKLENQQ